MEFKCNGIISRRTSFSTTIIINKHAEIALGKELTTNAYGWMPDAWTAFEGNSDDGKNLHSLVAILAFDYGD